jgi:hypothetical protein
VHFTTLPRNYVLGITSREVKTIKPFDEYLYGHPQHRFRSAKDFAVHVASLLLDNRLACRCESCNPKPKSNKKGAKSSSTPQTNPDPIADAVSASPMMDTDYSDPSVNPGVDDDGSTNIVDQLLGQAMQGQAMSVPIAEPTSIHWLLEKEIANLPAYLKSISSGKLYTPRLGEILLVARNLGEEQYVKFDEASGVHKIYDPTLGWVGLPLWEAAVVTQSGSVELTAGLLGPDLGAETDRDDGFRVEPMSEVGNPNKAWSTRYKQVNLFHMRHFSYWQELLGGIDINNIRDFHPTIRHALTAMSSVSLVERFHFSSNGTEARVYCKGIYIGAEFIVKNDVVRFISPIHNNSFGKDVIWIKHIYVSYNLDREPTLGSIHAEGYAYTSDPAHASGDFQRPIPAESLPSPTMRDYGLWYKMEGGNLIRVPYTSLYTRLTGGLYGTGIIGKPTLAKVARGGGARHLGLTEHIMDITYGFEGTRLAREYSQQNDARLQGSGKTWYMAEDRVDQLDLHLINGQDVGHNARFGEPNPTLLQQTHLKAMARARVARQKDPKTTGYDPSATSLIRNCTKNVSEDFISTEVLKETARGFDILKQKGLHKYDPTQNYDILKQQGLDKYSNIRGIDKFESEFTQRTSEADMEDVIP